jgi:signal peptidase I
MSLDSEDKRSDFAKWAEEMSYEDEKELKKQKKLEEKERKKAEKLAKKGSKSSDEEPSDKPGDEEETSEAADEDLYEDEEYNPDYKKVKKKKNKDEVNIVKELLSLIIYIGIIIMICYCIITFVGQRTTVHGHSMETTLQDGDNLWIDKLTYHFSNPKRFDIIVFPYQGQDVYYIKRVIGLPGETVQITPDGSILINGEVLSESYGREVMVDSGTASEPLTLGPDEFFVLGDNRNDSRDSRWADVGNINKKDIIGKAVLRLTPFGKFGKIDK